MVWLRRAISSGQNPFFTHDLWYPDGATLVFQTFDLPDSLLGAAVIHLFGLWPTYNLIVLWTFVASAAAMYVLGRGTGASRPASFFSGCAYSFCTYHFAHALAHLHLLSMEWVPLYVLALWRVLETRSWRWACGGGFLLALASLSSWYYLVACFLITVGVVLTWFIAKRGRGLLAFVPRVSALCAVFLLLVGPLGVAMVHARAAEPVTGSHPASFYSADLESFVYPNAAQALSRWSTRFHHWTGNAGEAAEYLGLVLMALVCVGGLMGAPRVVTYLLVSILGVVYCLGPALHIAGAVVTGDVLPYARLNQFFPLLDFMGVPMRLSFVASFGLSAALAPALDAMKRRISWWILAPLASLAVLEHTPHPLVMSTLPSPAPMLAWASDPTPFAVLDASAASETVEWHQCLHGHPVFGVWLSRTPERLIAKLEADPIAGPLRSNGARRGIAISREAALQHLHDLSVRYIVQPAGDSRFIPETQLGLHSFYEGDGVRIYEVAPS
jgi:hypothetical protein